MLEDGPGRRHPGRGRRSEVLEDGDQRANRLGGGAGERQACLLDRRPAQVAELLEEVGVTEAAIDGRP